MAGRNRQRQRTRRLALLVVAFCCAALETAVAQEQPGKPAPDAGAARPAPRQQNRQRNRPRRPGRRSTTSQPASAPAPEPTSLSADLNVAEARRRLGRTPAVLRKRSDAVLMAALDVALAIGQADGKRATTWLDASGYAALPLAGELPERPDKPLPPSIVEHEIADRPKVEVGKLPLSCFEVLRPEELRDLFPAIARWMSPAGDWAVVFHPPAEKVANWVTRDACLVIRLRAGRAAVLGGNLLQVLAASTEPPAAPSVPTR